MRSGKKPVFLKRRVYSASRLAAHGDKNVFVSEAQDRLIVSGDKNLDWMKILKAVVGNTQGCSGCGDYILWPNRPNPAIYSTQY